MEVVNLFWDKTKLSNLELICLKSYLENNHKVNLFTYNKELKAVDHKNFNLLDANEIIEEKYKFYYLGNGDCPTSSVVGFSDIFRYELLYKVGGWYSDMDVVNFKNLSSASTYNIVLRPHVKYRAISNICKFEKNYEPLKELRKTTEMLVTEQNKNWTLPLQLFFDFVVKNNLIKYVVDKSIFGDDDDKFIHHLLFDNYLFTRNSIKDLYCIHLCRSAFSSGNWNMKAIYNFDSPKNMTLLNFLYYKYLQS